MITFTHNTIISMGLMFLKSLLCTQKKKKTELAKNGKRSSQSLPRPARRLTVQGGGAYLWLWGGSPG